MARTGRRPGHSDTRAAILSAARAAFAERGFDGASIRAIATSAGVDPALVHHYFGTKDQLFLATLQVPIDPSEIIPAIVTGDPDKLGERIVRAVLTVWDSPAGSTAAAVVRSAMQQEWTARMLRDFLTTQIMRRVTKALDLPVEDVPLRTSLAISQVLGLVTARYIVQIEPLATAPPELVVGMVGPTVQRYLTGALPAGRERTGEAGQATP